MSPFFEFIFDCFFWVAMGSAAISIIYLYSPLFEKLLPKVPGRQEDRVGFIALCIVFWPLTVAGALGYLAVKKLQHLKKSQPPKGN
jgi:hypothetical protein